MKSAFAASYIVLWLVVLVESGLLLVLLREIGKVYLSESSSFQRDGLQVGKVLPQMVVTTKRGLSRLDSFLGQRYSLVLVASDGCAVCGPTADIIRRWANRGSEIGAVVLLNADRLGAWGEIDDLPVVLASRDDVKDRLQVRATPFVFVTDSGGRILSKGLINTHGHLKQLLKEARGHADEAAIHMPKTALVALSGEGSR